MKHTALALSAAILIGLAGCAEKNTGPKVALNWLTDYVQAKTLARTEGKFVLMDFTGSDWCGWCIKFDGEVFDTQTFKNYADTNLVLLQLDFPQAKPLGEAQKKANDDLQKQFKVEGFPTFVVLNQEGREVWRQEGYSAGGPKAFIAKLDKLKTRQP